MKPHQTRVRPRGVPPKYKYLYTIKLRNDFEMIDFTLEKIQDFIQPIEKIENKINSLLNLQKKTDQNKALLKNIEDKDFVLEFEDLINQGLKTTENLIEISENNLNTYLKVYEHLIRKRKDALKKKLTESKLDKNKIHNFGLFLIEDKNISRVVSHSSYIQSINFETWSDILDSLRQNTVFKTNIHNLNQFYLQILEKNFKSELKRIPEGTEDSLIEDYKREYYENPELSFNDYLNRLQSELSKEELKKREKIIEETKKRQKIEDLKKSQESQRDTYEEYLKYSEEEFQRRRRRQKRKTLSDLVSKSMKGDEVTDDIKEKISKFKQKLNNSFEDKYLVQKEGEQDPLDIIRERKDKKKKEYKKHIKKFKSEDNE